MKKIISLTFVLIFALCITGCGKVSDVTSDAESMGESVVSDTQSDVESVASGDDINLMAGITASDARDAALKHAELEKSQVKDVDVDLERQNGKLVYEVNFESGNTEYNYVIDAETGDVISSYNEND